MSKPKPTYIHWLDVWIFSSFPMGAEAMGLYRILYALYLLIWGIPNFEWIANSPDSFFNPPTYSLAALFTGFPPYWFLQGLSLLIALLCLMLLFGWHTRIVSISLFLGIVIGNSFKFSYGLIGQDLITWLVPALMSFANWGAKYSIDEHLPKHSHQHSNWPVTMMALLLGFGMFSAGLPKLLGGWLSIATHATRGHFFTQYYVIGDLKLLATTMVNVTNPIVWEIMDWGAVWFELLFLAAVLWPRMFRIWLLLAVGFHTVTFLIFNISFHFQYIVYLLFIRWEKVTAKFYNTLHSLAQRWITKSCFVAAVLVYMPLYVLAQHYTMQPGTLAPSPFIMATDLLGFDYKIVMGTTALCAAYIVVVWQLTSKGSST